MRRRQEQTCTWNLLEHFQASDLCGLQICGVGRRGRCRSGLNSCSWSWLPHSGGQDYFPEYSASSPHQYIFPGTTDQLKLQSRIVWLFSANMALVTFHRPQHIIRGCGRYHARPNFHFPDSPADAIWDHKKIPSQLVYEPLETAGTESRRNNHSSTGSPINRWILNKFLQVRKQCWLTLTETKGYSESLLGSNKTNLFILPCWYNNW